MSNRNRKARLLTSAGKNRLEVTVYNGGYSLVQESRTLKLSQGNNHVLLDGMPAQYKPASLFVQEVTGEGDFTLGPVSYKGASLNGQRLLTESLGQEVTVRTHVRKGKVREVTGKLLAFNGNQVILEVESGKGKKVVVVNGTDEHEFAALPKGLSNSPSLVLQADAGARGDYLVRFLYQTAGLQWNATHTAVYDEAQGLLKRLESWVSVTNGSGAAFTDAVIKLLSGDINGQDAMGGAGLESVRSFAAAAPKRANVRQAQAQSVGEQKLYTLPGTNTLAEGENQQIPLFVASDVPVVREYFLPAAPAWQRDQQTSIVIRLKLTNDEANKLGKPLPPGQVNILQPDTDGSLQLTGTAQMNDVAVGESFGLVIGACTDLKAERKLVESKEEEPAQTDAPEGAPEALPQLGDPGTKSSRVEPVDEEETPTFLLETWEVTLHNYKQDRDVEVVVNEEFANKFEIVESTHEFKAEGANRASATVKVPQAGKIVVRYIARVQQ